MTTDEAVNAVRLVDRAKRTERVNVLLAGTTLEPLALQAKAFLITALREQGVWPQGCTSAK